MDNYIDFEDQEMTNEQMIERYIAFNEKKKYFEKELKIMREDIFGRYPVGNTLVGPFMVAISTSMRTALDQSAVKTSFPEIFRQCTRTSEVTKLECIRVED